MMNFVMFLCDYLTTVKVDLVAKDCTWSQVQKKVRITFFLGRGPRVSLYSPIGDGRYPGSDCTKGVERGWIENALGYDTYFLYFITSY